MSEDYPSAIRVSHGLESIDPDETVEVNLRSLMVVLQTLGELNSFFHQPENYPTLDHLSRFLGTKDRGAYRLIHKAYYEHCWGLLPAAIQSRIEDFDSPLGGFDNLP